MDTSWAGFTEPQRELLNAHLQDGYYAIPGNKLWPLTLNGLKSSGEQKAKLCTI